MFENDGKKFVKASGQSFATKKMDQSVVQQMEMLKNGPSTVFEELKLSSHNKSRIGFKS